MSGWCVPCCSGGASCTNTTQVLGLGTRNCASLSTLYLHCIYNIYSVSTLSTLYLHYLLCIYTIYSVSTLYLLCIYLSRCISTLQCRGCAPTTQLRGRGGCWRAWRGRGSATPPPPRVPAPRPCSPARPRTPPAPSPPTSPSGSAATPAAVSTLEIRIFYAW